jgi:hypothetical protein
MQLLIVTGLSCAGSATMAGIRALMERAKLEPELHFLEREG